ncbi:LOW QUALITY PROTEIN: aminoacyl tRNA synthase complex-interacting multifunctional protein 1-like [Liolophura sinensis]|uniref:LOW QUALITY PROTEIN: aminoacyl tRNA synthase complex-interacting multifunctional protein 1-like n=1 Tax=Liolophura sinensis TaxID=3198878 RepID=UPI003159806D
MLFGFIRMASTEMIQRLKSRADSADEIIAQLRHQLSLIKQAKVSSQSAEAEKRLQIENENLRKEVQQLKKELALAEIHNGVKQVFAPANRNVVKTSDETPVAFNDIAKPNVKTKSPDSPKSKSADQKKEKEAKKSDSNKEKPEEKPKTKKGNKPSPTAAADVKIDASRLDMRVGHIVSAIKHPNADRLFVEDVNVGEEKNRTVVSGLAGKIPLEQMQDRLAVFMLNLKPAKMVGIQSEGMIMCVSEGEKVEILVPPPGAAIGDRVTCPDYEGTPDAQLNPKKKIWEQIKPDMKTNADKAACYKGSVFSVAGKGPLTAPTLANGQIS